MSLLYLNLFHHLNYTCFFLNDSHLTLCSYPAGYLNYLQIFTGVFPRHYDPPDGFVFEINDVSPPIQVNLPKHMEMTLIFYQIYFCGANYFFNL